MGQRLIKEKYKAETSVLQVLSPTESADGLRRAIGEAHRRYTRFINFREKSRGHLWQGRFASFVMDEQYLLAATRYIELNPVKAGLVSMPEQYPWSSAKAHLKGKDDDLVKVTPLLEMVDDWQHFLSNDVSDKECALLQRHERTGRPLGSERFIAQLENTLSRILTPQKGGRPRKAR